MRPRPSVLACLALVALLGRPAAQADDPVAREWWVRAVASAPEAHADELLAALAASSWRTRATALEALTRAAEGEGAFAPVLSAGVRRALADAHPSVRARALAALGALGAALAPEEARRFLAERLPSVRLELARALEFCPSPGRALLLARLARDEDERVSARARNALCGLEADEAGVADARLGLLEELARREEPAALARFLFQLAEAPLADGAAWFGEARARLASAAPAARAWLEALAFARLGSGAAAVLVVGAAAEDAWEPSGARVFSLAARAGSAELARALLARLGDESLQGVARRGMLQLVLDSVEPEGVPFLRRAAPPPELLSELIGELGLRRDAWDAGECAPWTEAGAATGVRRALLSAAADAYTRAADAGAAALLARFLEAPEPELAARAFEVLCEGPTRVPEIDAALHAAYLRLGEDERLARLGWFSRAEPLPVFRADWLAIGQRSSAQRALACELLAGFRGSSEVRAALEGWLAEDLERLAAATEVPRALEQRLQAELRALARVSDGDATEIFQSLLLASLGISGEIGKVAVAALGRSVAGRAALEPFLLGETLARPADRRTRIEAAIVLAADGSGTSRRHACELLLQDREGTTWDLRERMLRALAASGEPLAFDALCGLLLAQETAPVERAALATLLGELRRPEGLARAREVLHALVRSGDELESRRVALRALGELGDAAGLAALFEELGLAEAAEGDERALLRGEFLVALARLSAPPEWLCREWLEAPLAQAARDLEQRFAGLELPATGFAWRNELELAQALAQGGGVEACLACNPGWERLDGRLLLALGEALEAEDRPAEADLFLAAGTRALLGERDPDPTLLSWARALRLSLAWRGERWGAAAWLGARTLSERRAGHLSESRWTRLFGSFARASDGEGEDEPGVDPDARVRAARWQAEARAALAAGEPDRARAATARAATECGSSALARTAQRALEKALAGGLPASPEAR